MKYINAFLILLLLYMSYITARGIAKSNKIADREKKNFWTAELEANSVRRADISNLDYIEIPFDFLPVEKAEKEGCKDQVLSLKNLSQKKIINLSAYTNTELKLMYGPANLDSLSQYDSNFTELIKLLNKIGETLIDNNQSSLAKVFLEYAISIGSDISSTYVNLGNIYIQDKETEKLNQLMASAESLTSLSKSTITTKLNNIKSSDK